MNMKKLLLILVSTLVLIIVGCSSSVTTPDNTVLLNESFKIPKGFDGAKEQNYVIKKLINEIGAECTFNISILEKGTNRKAIKSLEIILTKGVQNYELQAKTTTEQPSPQNGSNLSTFVTVSIIYSTETFGQKVEWETFMVNSLGEVNEF